MTRRTRMRGGLEGEHFRRASIRAVREIRGPPLPDSCHSSDSWLPAFDPRRPLRVVRVFRLCRGSLCCRCLLRSPHCSLFVVLVDCRPPHPCPSVFHPWLLLGFVPFAAICASRRRLRVICVFRG